METKQIKVQLGQGEKNVIFFADVIPEVNYQIEIPRVCMALGFYEIASYANMIKEFNDIPEIGKIFSKKFGDTTYHVVFSSENGLSNSKDYELISKSLLEKFGKEDEPIAVITGRRCSGHQYLKDFPKGKVNLYKLSLGKLSSNNTKMMVSELPTIIFSTKIYKSITGKYTIKY